MQALSVSYVKQKAEDREKSNDKFAGQPSSFRYIVAGCGKLVETRDSESRRYRRLFISSQGVRPFIHVAR